MKRASLLALLLAASAPLHAEYSPRDALMGCEGMNASARADTLSKLTDPQVERSLCMTTLTTVYAIQRGHTSVQNACLEASEHLMREFKRRWPARDPKETTRTCSS